MKYKLLLFFILLPFLSLSEPGTNSSAPKGFHDRAMAREKGRWSLAEWLEQRDRNRMMDLWLSFNSPSPFEAMLGVYSLNSKSTSTGLGSTTSQELSGTDHLGEIRLYAQAVGLTFEHINSASLGYSNLLWLFNLRLFGNSLQNSSLVISLGKQEIYFYPLKTGVSNYLGQVTLQIYFSKYFGIESYYRHIDLGTGKDSTSGTTLSTFSVKGKSVSATAFIDFSAIRILGGIFEDNYTYSESIQMNQKITGVTTGLRLFY